MTAKPLFPSDDANEDVDIAATHYAREAGRDIARSFAAELEATYAKIVDGPKLGSPRYAHELGIADLRHRKLRRFPYLVFYVEQEDRIDIWRVLHAARDIPAWLTGNDD